MCTLPDGLDKIRVVRYNCPRTCAPRGINGGYSIMSPQEISSLLSVLAMGLIGLFAVVGGVAVVLPPSWPDDCERKGD